MASTLDYLRWRGDLPFQACPFNSLDASLMASLAYLPFDSSTVGHSLGEVCQSIYQREPDRWQNLDKTELLLLPKSPRLADLTVLDWVNKMEIEPEPIQFNAGAFRLDDRTILVAYRGTDQSMIGWSEDMVMDYIPDIGWPLSILTRSAKLTQMTGSISPATPRGATTPTTLWPLLIRRFKPGSSSPTALTDLATGTKFTEPAASKTISKR